MTDPDPKQVFDGIIANIKSHKPVTTDELLDAFQFAIMEEVTSVEGGGNTAAIELFLLAVAGEDETAFYRAVKLFAKFDKSAPKEQERTRRFTFRGPGGGSGTKTGTAGRPQR